MRTTLAIDDDVHAQLERIARERHLSFKVVVNENLRRGLQAELNAGNGGNPRTFATPEHDLSGYSFASLDNVHEVLSVAEGNGLK